MTVKDIYKAVIVENPLLSTVKFILYLNEAILALKNKYSGITQEDITDIEEELTIDERFKTAIVKYILVSTTTDNNLYNKYMSEYLDSASNANLTIKKSSGTGRIFVPRHFR
jgi:hypothetical protein